MKTDFSRWKGYEYLALFATLLSVGACLLPPDRTPFSRLESYAFELMLILLSGGLLSFIFSETKLMAIAFGGCALLCYTLHQRTEAPLKPAGHTADAFSLRIGVFRLPPEGDDPGDALQTIIGTHADVLTLRDIRSDLFPRVDEFLTSWGYRSSWVEQYLNNDRVLALYSRYPIGVQRRIHYRNSPSIIGHIQLPQSDSILSLTFLCTALSPADSGDDTEPAGDLRALARQLRQSAQPMIAAGDFSFVPWSQHIQAFKSITGLRDSRRDMYATSRGGHLRFFSQPTEHIFYSRQFECVDLETFDSTPQSPTGIVGTYRLMPRPPKAQTHVSQTAQEL